VSELTLTVLRLGLLALLWVFVFAVVGVLRADLYGTRVSRRKERSAAKAQARAQELARQRAAQQAAAAPRVAAGAAAGGAGAVAATGRPATAAGVGAAGAAGRGTPAPPPAPGRGRGRGGRGIPTTLVVTEGPLAGTTIPLTSAAMIIGRNPECALVLDDDFASGRHARLFQRDGGWWVEDLGSTNGTYLAGAKLTAAQPISIGSVMRIGRTVLELQG